MAGRTLLQQALPTTFGLKAAGWLAALDDAAEDVGRAAGLLPAQLGGAAGTPASLGPHGPVLAAYARALQLPEPVLPWHTARMPVARAAAAAGAAAGVAGKVARPDHRGPGHHEGAGTAVSPVEVHAVVEGPRDAPVLVLSPSLGATVATWEPQARALGGRFRVVRYDPRGHGRSPGPPGPYTLDDLAGDVVARWFTPGFAAAHPQVVDRMRAMVAATPAEAYAACCEAIERMDLGDALPRITAPTLVIAGREDPATPPEHAEAIARQITGAQIRVLSPAAHLANLEQPDTVSRLVAEHLTGHGPES